MPTPGNYAVKLVAGSRFAVPGARVSTHPLLTEPWVLSVKPVEDLAAFGTTGAASMSFSVAPPAAGLQPMLGAIEFGALVQVEIGGVALQRRVTTGFDCSFVQLWHLIGPFANEGGKGLQTVYPPEEKIDDGHLLRRRARHVGRARSGSCPLPASIPRSSSTSSPGSSPRTTPLPTP